MILVVPINVKISTNWKKKPESNLRNLSLLMGQNLEKEDIRPLKRMNLSSWYN
jgi:hypothetical protein